MTEVKLEPAGRAMLIGSQPLRDHGDATRLVLRYVPEIPNWVQLPVYPQEGMVAQFAAGMPGLVPGTARLHIDTDAADFDDAMVAFFEAYLLACEQPDRLDAGPFALEPEIAAGFYRLMEMLTPLPRGIFAVKGQITGPITFCTALTDQDRRAVFYNEALRDAAVKLLALKAAWQVRRLATLGVPVIVFIDEPALAGYGASDMISISREDIATCLQEVIDAIHRHGGLAGVHVCANTDWSLLLDANVDVVNFDAYGYFDRFILYAEPLRRFLKGGGCLAWGLVPTAPPDQVAGATLDGLWDRWQACLGLLTDRGFDREAVRRQSFITPSCGTGSLSPELSHRVLELTQALSERVKNG